jgi:hypothetical protein
MSRHRQKFRAARKPEQKLCKILAPIFHVNLSLIQMLDMEAKYRNFSAKSWLVDTVNHRRSSKHVAAKHYRLVVCQLDFTPQSVKNNFSCTPLFGGAHGTTKRSRQISHPSLFSCLLNSESPPKPQFDSAVVNV